MKDICEHSSWVEGVWDCNVCGAHVEARAASEPQPAVDALEEGKKIMEKLWADPNGPFLKGQWEAPIAQPAVDALTTGAVPLDCDVRKILLRVVPGDGDGHEVYAKNVADVENLLSEMGERLEDFESTHPASEPEAPAVDALTTGAVAKPIATLHDDGYYRFHGEKPNGYNYAGWRMDVYAHPASAPKALTDARIEELIDMTGGFWVDDEFRINGKELMNLCRLLADRGS